MQSALWSPTRPAGERASSAVLGSPEYLGQPLHIPFLPLRPPLHLRPGCPGAAAPAPCERASPKSGSGSRSPRSGGGRRDAATLGAARRRCTKKSRASSLENRRDVSPISHLTSPLPGSQWAGAGLRRRGPSGPPGGPCSRWTPLTDAGRPQRAAHLLGHTLTPSVCVRPAGFPEPPHS